ncbi:MAG: integral rane sensor signal transduction histidine kinase, partial [Rhodospirillales bacterium]|nr:integral rane sensor signal transduction histidine kinase [Rhodospirillales bacterium]
MRLPWPASLGGRTLIVLFAATVLVYLVAVLAYQHLAEEAADQRRIGEIAERLAAAIEEVSDQPSITPAAIARALSSAGLKLVWGPAAMVDDATATDQGLRDVRQHLLASVPTLAEHDLRLRYDNWGDPTSTHMLLGELQLPDGSYLGFTAALLPNLVPSVQNVLFFAPFILGSILLITIILVRTVNAPLRELARIADRIGHDRLVPVPERGPDEVRHLARALDTMQSRIHRLLADRTEAMAAVSHDLRTPLARLRLRCGLLGDQVAKAEIDRDLQEMEAMIAQTLAYFRGDGEFEEPRMIDVAAMLETIVNAVADAGRQACFDGPPYMPVLLRRLAVTRALGNLVDNALTYGKAARVELRQMTDWIIITV